MAETLTAELRHRAILKNRTVLLLRDSFDSALGGSQTSLQPMP